MPNGFVNQCQIIMYNYIFYRYIITQHYWSVFVLTFFLRVEIPKIFYIYFTCAMVTTQEKRAFTKQISKKYKS